MTSKSVLNALEKHRRSIDNIDAALIYMLAERFKQTQEVGKLKAEAGLAAADQDREKRQIKRLRELAHSAALDPDFAEKLLAFIIKEVIQHHTHIAQTNQTKL